MENVRQLPYSESYWVVTGKLMAGEYPGVYDEEMTRQRIKSLLRCGVTSIIDLTKPGDSFYPYKEILEEEAAQFEVTVTWQNFPIVDFSTPTPSQMEGILEEIDLHVAGGMTVYVHCLAGIGRTGMVVGCYLVKHGLSGQEALMRIKTLRGDTSSWWHRSPESQQQVDFILNWENDRGLDSKPI